MAHTLNLVVGSTTIALASGDYRIRDYTPRTPNVGDEEIIEQCEIEVTASSLANLQSDVQAIQKAFERAKLRQDGVNWTQLFVQIQPDGYTALYQSEIVEGRVILPNETLKGSWANYQLNITLMWRRKAFWEAVDWTLLPLTNPNGTDVTTGLRVYNCSDLTGVSPNVNAFYTDIDGDDVVGDLPGPVKLRMTVAQDTNGIYIHHYADENGVGFPIYRVDSNSWVVGADTPDAASSNGGYQAITLPATAAVLRSTPWAAVFFKGTYLQAVARFSAAPPAGTYLRLRVTQNSVPVITTPYMRLSTKLQQSLGVVRLPPYPPLSSATSYTAALDGYNAAGGTLQFDVLYMMGVDSYAEIGRDDALVVAATERFIEQWGLDRRSWKEDGAGGTQLRFCNIDNGVGIFLKPGADQRLFFLMRNGDASAISMNMTVECWHRPRRMTL